MLRTESLKFHALLIYGADKGSIHCEMRSSVEPKFYRIAVRISDGACYCECPWFQFRCKWATPTIYSGRVCRHISTYREFLQGELLDLATDQQKEVSSTCPSS